MATACAQAAGPLGDRGAAGSSRVMTKLRWFPVVVFTALAALASGCFGSPVYTAPRIQTASSCLSAPADADRLVGLTVSGRGSRAALFAAGGMEALAKLQVGSDRRSLLDHVSYVSSVSDGSLASAYYTLKKPRASCPSWRRTGTCSRNTNSSLPSSKRS
jgi:hypothetical protein